MDIKGVLLQWFIHLFDEKTSGGAIRNENISNKELAEELHKRILKKFKKIKLHSSFIDNIWSTDQADMQLISKFDKRIRFIDIFRKNAWFIPLRDKKGITITNVFQKILKESNRNLDKIWIYKASEFHSRSMKSWLEKNDILRKIQCIMKENCCC